MLLSENDVMGCLMKVSGRVVVMAQKLSDQTSIDFDSGMTKGRLNRAGYQELSSSKVLRWSPFVQNFER